MRTAADRRLGSDRARRPMSDPERSRGGVEWVRDLPAMRALRLRKARQAGKIPGGESRRVKSRWEHKAALMTERRRSVGS